MLKNLHLVGENEDDGLYSDFKELDDDVSNINLNSSYLSIAVCAMT